MVNVIIHGCGGKMGHVVAELVKNEPDCQVVAGIDPTTPALDFPVFPSCEACDVAGDVIIDFSTAKAVPALLAFSKAKKIPVVLCTTALSEETTALMQETSKEVAILKSANMSVGVNLLLVPLPARISVRQSFWQKAASISKSWKNITIRRLMPPAAPQWLWQMLSIRQWRNGIIMYMIVLRCVKKEKKTKSGFMQCAAAISSASMMSFLPAEMKSLS